MDGYDIWRKLIVGTSFDPTKRRRRKKSKKSKKNAESEKKLNESYQTNEKQDNISMDNDFESDERNTESEEHKNKKQKTKSFLQLMKIRQEEVRHLRKKHHIYVTGSDIPDPVESFAELQSAFNIHNAILENIHKSGFITPTAIQMQVIPLLINDRQVLACAPTGSGKTAAFLIPILHKLRGPKNIGFRALILAPTRELAKQIHLDCMRLADGTNLRPCIIDKVKAIKQKPTLPKKHDILVSTPNRLIYLLQHDPPLVTLDKLEWLIVDESDKLFETGEKGFRDQLATIYNACDSINVKRAMFSATYSNEVEQWCMLNLDSVVSVSVGVKNSAVDTIKQELVFVGCESGKIVALRNLVLKGLPTPALIFVQSKERATELFKQLIYDGIYVDVIHSDRTQLERDNVVKAFKAGKIWVLICTELMARGIDFKGVDLVLNYDMPPSVISYIHRIGRTGRAGKPGHAITYFTENDRENLRNIAQVIKNSGGKVPEYIFTLKKKKKEKGKVFLPIKRDPILTIPKYQKEREAKIEKLKEISRKRKLKRQQRSQQQQT